MNPVLLYGVGGLVVALLLSMATAGHYRSEFKEAEAKHEAFVASVTAAATKDKADRLETTIKVEAAHVKLDKERTDRITALTDLVRVAQTQRSASARTVSGAATICDDDAQNKRLTTAISAHYTEVRNIIASERNRNRQIVGKERTDTLGLINEGQTQTNALIIAQDWINAQMKVNSVKP